MGLSELIFLILGVQLIGIPIIPGQGHQFRGGLVTRAGAAELLGQCCSLLGLLCRRNVNVLKIQYLYLLFDNFKHVYMNFNYIYPFQLLLDLLLCSPANLMSSYWLSMMFSRCVHVEACISTL